MFSQTLFENFRGIIQQTSQKISAARIRPDAFFHETFDNIMGYLKDFGRDANLTLLTEQLTHTAETVKEKPSNYCNQLLSSTIGDIFKLALPIETLTTYIKKNLEHYFDGSLSLEEVSKNLELLKNLCDKAIKTTPTKQVGIFVEIVCLNIKLIESLRAAAMLLTSSDIILLTTITIIDQHISRALKSPSINFTEFKTFLATQKLTHAQITSINDIIDNLGENHLFLTVVSSNGSIFTLRQRNFLQQNGLLSGQPQPHLSDQAIKKELDSILEKIKKDLGMATTPTAAIPALPLFAANSTTPALPTLTEGAIPASMPPSPPALMAAAASASRTPPNQTPPLLTSTPIRTSEIAGAPPLHFNSQHSSPIFRESDSSTEFSRPQSSSSQHLDIEDSFLQPPLPTIHSLPPQVTVTSSSAAPEEFSDNVYKVATKNNYNRPIKQITHANLSVFFTSVNKPTSLSWQSFNKTLILATAQTFKKNSPNYCIKIPERTKVYYQEEETDTASSSLEITTLKRHQLTSPLLSFQKINLENFEAILNNLKIFFRATFKNTKRNVLILTYLTKYFNPQAILLGPRIIAITKLYNCGDWVLYNDECIITLVAVNTIKIKYSTFLLPTSSRVALKHRVEEKELLANATIITCEYTLDLDDGHMRCTDPKAWVESPYPQDLSRIYNAINQCCTEALSLTSCFENIDLD